MQQALENLHWAIAFSVATGVLNLLSIGLCVYASFKMRQAMKHLREAADNLSHRPESPIGH